MPFRDGAFEACIIERVVFNVNRKTLHLRIEAGPFRYGPALERAVELQSEIVVEPGGVVLLYAKLQGLKFGIFASLRCLG